MPIICTEKAGSTTFVLIRKSYDIILKYDHHTVRVLILFMNPFHRDYYYSHFRRAYVIWQFWILMGYIYDELLSISELVLDRRELRELVFVGPIVYGVVALCAFGHGNLSSRLPVKI